jgi:hypothetical protein
MPSVASGKSDGGFMNGLKDSLKEGLSDLPGKLHVCVEPASTWAGAGGAHPLPAESALFPAESDLFPAESDLFPAESDLFVEE